MSRFEQLFLQSSIKRLGYYKELADKTLAVLQTSDLHFQPNPECNSIAIIIQHISGNMLSRWTNFLNSDGEKDWRNRDSEFEIRELNKSQLMEVWQSGWDCCLNTLKNLTDEDLEKSITIRDEQLTVTDAIIRQMAHYPYHIGQMIYIARMIKGPEWESLSIPKNKKQQ